MNPRPPSLSRRLLLACLALAACPAFSGAAENPMARPARDAVAGRLPTVPPKTPAEAAKSFRVLDGFRMDLLAAEPQVHGPVAMTYDENGRAYVCEMRDYPYTDKANHKPSQENPTDAAIGRVSLLEDTDGDGVFDRATVFAEGLSWPTGVACWQGGVFVIATPDLWYLKDTDGDGRADIREKVLTGFRKLNVQAVANNLVWGLDNRIHGAGGTNGGRIVHTARPELAPVTLARADFRLDPVTRAFELMSGGARFGGTFDDWGQRYLCNIRNPAQHIVLPLRYLARNKSLAARSPLHDMAEAGDQLPVYAASTPEPWRVLRARRWAGERDIVMPRSELVGAGVVTSSSGITVYRGTAYPEKYHGNLFVTECASNLLYRLQVTPDGVTGKAARVDGRAEMVASTDNWFRPVNFVNAPDGTLHVLDMYRENIEHPWSIPEDIHAAVDLEAGREMGRIWRLAPPGFKPPAPPRLGRATAAVLVATLEHPDAWWRETAQRLLFERQDKAAVPALRTLVRSGRTAQARLHALHTLDGLGALQSDDLLAALRDPAAPLREHAVALAEPRLAAAPALLDALLPLAADPAPRVRFQTAFTLGETKDARALPALAAIARRDASNSWIRTAVLTSVADSADRLLAALLADPAFVASPAAADLIRELAQLVGTRAQPAEAHRVLAAFAPSTDTAAPALREILAGLGDGLKRSAKSLRSVAAPAADDTTARLVDRALAAAARTAADSTAATADRAAAIRLLTFDDYARAEPALVPLLAPAQPPEVQRAALTALGSFNAPAVTAHLLAHWATQTPAVRAGALAAVLGSRPRHAALLAAIEDGRIPAHQIPFAQRRLLTLSTDAKIKEAATRLFSASAPGPRKDVVARYQAALTLRGDAARGRKVYEAACLACHRAGDLGTADLGPNLAAVRAWNPEQLLVNILDPNREVAPTYLGYTAETKDGRSTYGMIVEDSSTGVTLRRPDGTVETILRRDLAKLTGSGLSLMPDGLESAVSVEAMADLVAFLLSPPAP